MRIRLIKIIFILVGLFSNFVCWANATPSTGDNISNWEAKDIVLTILFLLGFGLLLKYFGVGPTKPGPPPPKRPPWYVDVADKIGGLNHQVGDGTFIGGKRVAAGGDKEIYVMMAKVDKSYIREEEEAIAEARYSWYNRMLFYAGLVSFVLIVFNIAFFHESILDFFQSIKDFFTSFGSES